MARFSDSCWSDPDLARSNVPECTVSGQFVIGTEAQRPAPARHQMSYGLPSPLIQGRNFSASVGSHSSRGSAAGLGPVCKAEGHQKTLRNPLDGAVILARGGSRGRMSIVRKRRQPELNSAYY
ncbi:MAG: hypothetical protein ABI137_02340 [Antricoccus sp.]